MSFKLKNAGFKLKNAGVTYQRLMDKIFKDYIGRNIEVYVDDMVVKSEAFDQHLVDMNEVFDQLRCYNMCLNLAKCVFGVEGDKFLGFILTHRGIEVNPDKCTTILSMQSHANLKDVQSLVGRLKSLSRFLPRLVKKVGLIVKTLKKTDKFKWDNGCEEAFNAVKTTVSSTPILEKPRLGSKLLLYISRLENAISSTLVQ